MSKNKISTVTVMWDSLAWDASVDFADALSDIGVKMEYRDIDGEGGVWALSIDPSVKPEEMEKAIDDLLE